MDPKAEAEAQEKKTKRRARRKARKTSDAHTTAKALIATGIVAMVFWIIPCFGTGWNKRMFFGFGIDMLTIRTGLFTIDVVVDCSVMDWGILNLEYFRKDEKVKKMLHDMNFEEQICKVFRTFNGTRSLHAARDLACVLNTNACQIMSTVFYSSIFLMFSFACSALTSLVSALFLYYYWYTEHLKKIRDWSIGLFAVAPCFGISGFGLYTLLSPDIGDIPRSWSAFVETFNGGTDLFKIIPIPGQESVVQRFGWCFFWSFISCATSATAPIIWGMWFLKHPDEKEHELAAILEMAEIEDTIEAIAQQEDGVRAKASPSDYDYGGASAYSQAHAGAYAPYGGAQAHAAPQPGVAGFPAYGAYWGGTPYAQQGYPGAGYR